jgi:hypothetical protein
MQLIYSKREWIGAVIGQIILFVLEGLMRISNYLKQVIIVN